MVIIHIANIDKKIIGGVQTAVPLMIKGQSKYANVAFINIHGDAFKNIEMIDYNEKFDIANFPYPFNRPDIIVFHEIYRFQYIKIYKKLVRLSIPYVIIPHGCLSKKAQSKKFFKKFIANILFFNKFIKNAIAIQYLSQNERKLSIYANKKFFISGNAIGKSKIKKNNFSNDCIKFVYIGRLDIWIKGLDLLLKAIEKNKDIFCQKKVSFDIYGPNCNHSRDKLKKKVDKLKLSNLVFLHKEVFYEQKEEALLLADCFIQTSRTEGLPLGLIEALGYGIPCIITKGTGLADIVEKYGAGYCCETNVNSISIGINCFIDNYKNVKNMSEASINLVDETFDLNKITKKMVDTYVEIIK